MSYSRDRNIFIWTYVFLIFAFIIESSERLHLQEEIDLINYSIQDIQFNMEIHSTMLGQLKPSINKPNKR